MGTSSSDSPGLLSWRPVLPPALAERALEAVEAIAADLAAAEPSALTAHVARWFSLGHGKAGLALFFLYLDQARPGRSHDETALELLDQAIEGVGCHGLGPDLYGGFAGVAWVLEHLHRRLGDPAGDPGEEVAARLVDLLGRSPWQEDFDLVSGLAGYGVWALERLPRPEGEEGLRRVMARLAETAERGPATVAWFSPPEMLPERVRSALPLGYYNTGVAHGVPGVIGFLGQALSAGVGEARELLGGAVRWLLDHRLPPGARSIFPSYLTPDAEPSPTRLAWCYGDAGVAAALLGAARRAGEPEWEREALAAARAAASRRGKETGVVDAGLCHGSAGLAHLFNRLYQASGDPRLAEAAVFWIERTLEMRKPGDGIGGFRFWEVDDAHELGWRADPGFLGGAAGVGLALLAAATPIEPAWDRLLLASISGLATDERLDAPWNT
jgi:hypothetical protein